MTLRTTRSYYEGDTDRSAGEEAHSGDSVGRWQEQINFSPVDIDMDPIETDKKFPLFRRARRMECVVRAGDMLYVPAFTFHQVYSWPGPGPELSASEPSSEVAADKETNSSDSDGGSWPEVNMALNLWFRPVVPRQQLVFRDAVYGALLDHNDGLFRGRLGEIAVASQPQPGPEAKHSS